MNTSQNLSDPAIRQKILVSIEPKDAKQHHQLLKQILCLEMSDHLNQKITTGDKDYSENLYWCGFLLYQVGDLTDVSLLWEAKQLDMDTGCGFDIQTLVGAGVEATIEYSIENNLQEIADYLNFCQKQGDFDELYEWEQFRYGYYYSQ